MTARDPRIDPEPSDFIEAKGFTFRVQYVHEGRVYLYKTKPGEEEEDYIWVTLDDWRRDLAEASK